MDGENVFKSEEVKDRWLSSPVQVDASAVRATSIVIGGNLLIIGGTKGLYLSVQCLVCNSLQATSHFVETNGVLNRTGHCLLAYQESVYIMGGLHPHSGDKLSQVGRLELNQFGFKASIVSYDDCCARTGMTASLFGVLGSEVCLFGGKDSKGRYSNEVTKFKPALDIPPENRFIPIEIAGDRPPARCNHSATVCGDKRQILIVVGGQSETGLLWDVWILDLSKADEANKAEAPLEDPKGKKAPPVKGQLVPDVSPTACVWVKLLVESNFESTLRRSMHVCVSSREESNNNVSLILAAGVDHFGDVLFDVHRLEVDLEGKVVTACQRVDDAALNPNCDCVTELPNLFTIADESGKVVLIAIFSASGTQLQFFILNDGSSHSLGAALQSKALAALEQSQKQQEHHANIDVSDIVPTFLSYEDGSSYSGDLVRDESGLAFGSTGFVRHGFGIMNFADGASYEGQFISDHKDGNGLFTFPNGTGFYEGSFLRDEISGNGTVNFKMPDHGEQHPLIRGMFADASSVSDFSYTGEFDHGSFNGFGYLKLSKFTYEGSFSYGRFNGRGLLSTESEQYNGNFEHGVRRDDNAECKYMNTSTIYKGSFRNGKRNGRGNLITIQSGQTIYSGKWIGDMKCGNGEMWFTDGSRYSGSFEGDLPTGQGTMFYADGSEYSGFWKSGRRHGKGTVVEPDGNAFICDFKNDEVVFLSTTTR